MAASAVVSHLPLALSLLQTVANQYPGLQKAQPTPAATVPAPPVATNPVPASSSAINIPAKTAATGNTNAASQPSSGPGNANGSATQSNLCEVSNAVASRYDYRHQTDLSCTTQV
jgi:hypothetical protein